MPNSRMANAGLSGLQRRPCGIIRISALCPLCRHRHKGHATGHPSRLNRPDLGTPFGSEAYAREELRAEIASLMIADKLGIGHDPGQHAAYVGSWIKALQQDPREIFRAAADAEKISGYLMALRAEQKAGQAAGRADSKAGEQARGYWQLAAESGAEIRRAERAEQPEQERQTRRATAGR